MMNQTEGDVGGDWFVLTFLYTYCPIIWSDFSVLPESLWVGFLAISLTFLLKQKHPLNMSLKNMCIIFGHEIMWLNEDKVLL